MADYIQGTRLEFDSRIKHVSVYDTELPVGWAKVAISLAERWGMVAADDAGEDSTGRQKIRLQEVDEVVQRACDTAQRLWAEFENRGVLLHIPPMEYDDDPERFFGSRRNRNETTDTTGGNE